MINSFRRPWAGEWCNNRSKSIPKTANSFDNHGWIGRRLEFLKLGVSIFKMVSFSIKFHFRSVSLISGGSRIRNLRIPAEYVRLGRILVGSTSLLGSSHSQNLALSTLLCIC